MYWARTGEFWRESIKKKRLVGKEFKREYASEQRINPAGKRYIKIRGEWAHLYRGVQKEKR